MKIFGYFLFLLFILSNIGVEGKYSIDSILDYLQQTRYYDLLQEIKNQFGDDVAIDVCKALTKSSDCEQIIRVYMTNGGNRLLKEQDEMKPMDDGSEQEIVEKDPMLYKKKLQDEKVIKNINVEPVIDLILDKYYEVLINNMTPTEMKEFFKTIDKIKILPLKK